METRIEYCVDTAYYDKNNKTYISYENNEYFVDYESAKHYFDNLHIEKNEQKTIWSFEIYEDGDWDNFVAIISE